MLSEGTYWGRVKLDGHVTSEAGTGSQQVECKIELTHIQAGDEWQALPKTEERTLFMALSDTAWQYTERKLQALGFNGDFASPDFSDEVKNNGTQFNVKHEQYNGKARERIELANWGTREVKVADNDAIRRLNALWKAGNGTKAPAPTGKPTAPPKAPAAPAAPSAAAAPASTATATIASKDDAWAYMIAEEGNKPRTQEERVAVFYKAVEKVGKGKPEADFTADDWQAVAEDAAIPF